MGKCEMADQKVVTYQGTATSVDHRADPPVPRRLSKVPGFPQWLATGKPCVDHSE